MLCPLNALLQALWLHLNIIQMKKLLAILLIPFLIMGCTEKEDPITPNIHFGKNKFTTLVDGSDREYIVSIPMGYDGSVEFPVVFMLHGTGGDGEKFYNISGWKELGEQENILTVYPSALSKCIITDGEQKTTSKWNSQPTSGWQYCSNVTPPDDVKFLSQIIDEIESKYKIDHKRIYFVGFSNGGQMCAKLSIQLGKRIAAIVESAGSFSVDTTFHPVRKMPITYQMGNGDYGPGNVGPFIPLSKLGSLLTLTDHRLYTISQVNIESFDLNPNYNITGDTNKVVVATYTPNDGNTTNNFNFALIKDLTHMYPNGVNHWMHGAQVNWNWLKQFSLP